MRPTGREPQHKPPTEKAEACGGGWRRCCARGAAQNKSKNQEAAGVRQAGAVGQRRSPEQLSTQKKSRWGTAPAKTVGLHYWGRSSLKNIQSIRGTVPEQIICLHYWGPVQYFHGKKLVRRGPDHPPFAPVCFAAPAGALTPGFDEATPKYGPPHGPRTCRPFALAPSPPSPTPCH